jgi:N-acyl-D-aspartate/D-glutamate deacylase
MAMEYDLLIRGGRVVDGSGAPGYQADVAVKDGRIVEIGRVTGGAARTIDAAGLVVAPGFIDPHTHLDAQMFWDPYGTSEPQNGVTSVVMGNCGLTVAPVKDAGHDALVKSFVRVEAIPRAAFEQGVPWGWHTYGDYLNALRGRVGINVCGLVGHVAIRHYVMGEDAVEREATDAEIAQMCDLVRQSLESGAVGLSLNRNSTHVREDGKPVASRLASNEERLALVDVLGQLKAGVIQLSAPGGQHKSEYIDWYDTLARRTNRPVVWQSVLHRWQAPHLWKQQLEEIEPTFKAGYRAYGLTNAEPTWSRFNLKNAQSFDEFPTWKALMFAPEAVRKQAFADPETRRKLHADMEDPRPTVFHRRWDMVEIVKVAKPENEKYLHKSVAEMAADRGQHPIDAFLDLSLEEDLETTFQTTINNGDPEAMAHILSSPYVMVGQSDAGAHVQFQAGFGYGTTLVGRWVRERGVLSLEQAIYKLTGEVASAYGLGGRGLVQTGYAADFAIFDPETVNPCEPEWADDFPGGLRRMVQNADGMRYTIVNGRVICEDGRLTGDLPGQVLRGPAYRGA